MSDTEARDQLAQIINEHMEADVPETVADKHEPVDADYAMATAILAAGWRPPARTVTTVEEVDALPDRSVVVAANRTALQCVGSMQPYWYGNVWCDAESRWWGSGDVTLPATVLWEPEEGE